MLRDLSLWDEAKTPDHDAVRRHEAPRDDREGAAHEPEILFLDEPTAGVDVELRRDMWALVRRLRDEGVTIILTTHYIDEAEEMADRIGVINKGELILVEEKADADEEARQAAAHPEPAGAAGRRSRRSSAAWPLALKADGSELEYTFDAHSEQSDIAVPPPANGRARDRASTT